MESKFDSESRKAAFEMFKIDFQMKYYAMLEALKERVKATRTSLTFLSAPFVVITALITTKIIAVSNIESFKFTDIPTIVYYFMALCGVAAIVPLWHFIEANSRYVRTIRVLNNFRSYYVTVLKEDYDKAQWARTKELPIDPEFPKTAEITTWAGIHIILMSIINSAYIALGISCAAGQGFALPACIALFICFLGFQFYLYKAKK